MFEKVEIDGTEVSISSLDTAQGQYQLSIGEHTVAYTLKNPTILGVLISEQIGTFTIGATFFQCSTITSVEMPSSVTSIGINAFSACTSLTSITIPSGVTTILNNAFGQCCSLDEDTIDFILSINQNAWSCSNFATAGITKAWSERYEHKSPTHIFKEMIEEETEEVAPEEEQP